MNSYHSLADDFYVSMNLSTEMELTAGAMSDSEWANFVKRARGDR